MKIATVFGDRSPSTGFSGGISDMRNDGAIAHLALRRDPVEAVGT
jgi:hypothetical protein